MAIAPQRIGIGIRRHFTTAGVHPYDSGRRGSGATPGSPTTGTGRWPSSSWTSRCPRAWSLNATNILAQKYFRGTPNTPERESSLRQVADRVVDTVTAWGIKDGYFADDEEAETFRAELKYLIVHQMAAFNSPVWFNIGVAGVPQQGSACFILSVDDTMDSILNWYTEEGVIFKGGSGAGVNLSRIRSSHELLKGGGTASGPVSFMRGADSSAGTIKSGGKTRRAAKMVILDADHPDIEDFIWCKAIEERKARVLRDAGFDMDLDGKDCHQPAVPERQQLGAGHRRVHGRRGRRPATGPSPAGATERRSARCRPATCSARSPRRPGSAPIPGMQFDTTINKWHTASNTGRINGSNPCSEYMHLDNSACNLASLNLMKFLREDSSFDVEGVPGRGRGHLHRPGDHRRQRRLPDREDRRELAALPPAGHRLRQPRRPADGPGPALRLRPGPGLGRRHHRPDDRARLCHLGPDRGPDGPVRRLPRERRADAQRAAHAPRRGGRHRRGAGADRAAVAPPRRPGTRPSSSASSTACATRRPACWPPPAPSAC